MRNKEWLTAKRKENLYVVGLFLMAIALYTSGIQNLALRDWDEGIVAGVARDIWRGFPDSNTWLYPTINNGQPYWNKPPLIHWIITVSYSLFGISEGSTRIFPALISACCIPLVYLIARELSISSIPAIFSASVYLTFLPIARHSKVAMLDGAINCWYCFAVWCLLRGCKNSRWLLGTGLGIGLICLTKGIMMGVLLGGILILFLLWNSPKLILSPYLLTSLVIGILPAIAWYILQYLHYGSEFLGTSLGEQTFNRIWQPISNASHPPWYYLLEIGKYGLPWLIFLPQGIRLAVKNHHSRWAKLPLVWCGVYISATSLMVTKLPWYIMPIYPGLSLLIGFSLAHAWEKKIFPHSWKIAFTVVTLICWIGNIFLTFSGHVSRDISFILTWTAIAFTIASILLWLSSRSFILVTIAGFYFALLLFFNTHSWLWELNEAFPVKSVATAIQQQVPPDANIYTAYPYRRPSLEFYSERLFVPVEDKDLKQFWQQSKPVYLLVDHDAIKRLKLFPHHKLSIKQNDQQWYLITQSNPQ